MKNLIFIITIGLIFGSLMIFWMCSLSEYYDKQENKLFRARVYSNGKLIENRIVSKYYTRPYFFNNVEYTIEPLGE